MSFYNSQQLANKCKKSFVINDDIFMQMLFCQASFLESFYENNSS